MGFWGAIVWLGVITIFISILSEYLVAAIEVGGGGIGAGRWGDRSEGGARNDRIEENRMEYRDEKEGL